MKGTGREEEGEQEADRLQQSTDALFRDRQDSPECRSLRTSHLGNLFSSFSSSQTTAAQRVQAGALAERKRGAEGAVQNWQPTNLADNWCRVQGELAVASLLAAAARAAPSLCWQQPQCRCTVRLGVCCSLPSHHNIPGREDTKQVTLLQERLI